MSNGKVDTKAPDSEELYERARHSAMDLLKMGVTLATAVLAAFFIALTKEPGATLSTQQRVCVLIVLICMVLSVASGLIGWGANSLFYANWAMREMPKGDNEESAAYESRKQRCEDRKKLWRKVRQKSLWASALLFLAGIIASAGYVFLRGNLKSLLG